MWKIKKEKQGIWYDALINKYGINFERSNSGDIGKDISNLNLEEIENSNEYSVKEAYKRLLSVVIYSHSLF